MSASQTTIVIKITYFNGTSYELVHVSQGADSIGLFNVCVFGSNIAVVTQLCDYTVSRLHSEFLCVSSFIIEVSSYYSCICGKEIDSVGGVGALAASCACA